MLAGPPRLGASLALPLAALAALWSSAGSAATVNAQVNASIVKPLAFTASGSLNFGTIVVNTLTASRTITLSQANVINCTGGSAELICSGPTSVPTYNVQGTNKSVLNIFKNASVLTNASTGSTLTLTPLGPTTVTLTNSGAPGSNFTIGGSITLTPATTAGTYSGLLDVTVEYQ